MSAHATRVVLASSRNRRVSLGLGVAGARPPSPGGTPCRRCGAVPAGAERPPGSGGPAGARRSERPVRAWCPGSGWPASTCTWPPTMPKTRWLTLTTESLPRIVTQRLSSFRSGRGRTGAGPGTGGCRQPGVTRPLSDLCKLPHLKRVQGR